MYVPVTIDLLPETQTAGQKRDRTRLPHIQNKRRATIDMQIGSTWITAVLYVRWDDASSSPPAFQQFIKNIYARRSLSVDSSAMPLKEC